MYQVMPELHATWRVNSKRHKRSKLYERIADEAVCAFVALAGYSAVVIYGQFIINAVQ